MKSKPVQDVLLLDGGGSFVAVGLQNITVLNVLAWLPGLTIDLPRIVLSDDQFLREFRIRRVGECPVGIGEHRPVRRQRRQDRLGHDRRYSLDTTKMQSLGWRPHVAFERGLAETIEWYKQNEWWWRPIKQEDPAFRAYYKSQYGDRA